MTDAERLDKINDILAAGASRVTIGDRTMEYDLAQLRRERDLLIARLSNTSNYKRVVFRRG